MTIQTPTELGNDCFLSSDTKKPLNKFKFTMKYNTKPAARFHFHDVMI